MIARAVPGRYAEAQRHAAQGLRERPAQVLAEDGHLCQIVMEREQDELVAAVADEDVAAVGLCMDDGGDLL